MNTLHRHFPSSRPPRDDVAEGWRVRQHYVAAVHVLAQQRVALRPDGVERYSAARRSWEPLILREASMLGYRPSEIDRRSEDTASNDE